MILLFSISHFVFECLKKQQKVHRVLSCNTFAFAVATTTNNATHFVSSFDSLSMTLLENSTVTPLCVTQTTQQHNDVWELKCFYVTASVLSTCCLLLPDTAGRLQWWRNPLTFFLHLLLLLLILLLLLLLLHLLFSTSSSCSSYSASSF